MACHRHLPTPVLALGITLAGACGGKEEISAADAALDCSRCSPAQLCSGGSCLCPAIDLAGLPAPKLLSLDTTRMAPLTLAVAIYQTEDQQYDALVTGYHPADTPVGLDIDLAGIPPGGTPYVGFGYQVDLLLQQPRAAYRSIGGTLHFERRCASSVLATATDLHFRELDGIGPGFRPDGCELHMPAMRVEIGTSCP